MHIPGLLTRLREATTLLEAYDLSESEHPDLLRRAYVKVAEVTRSLEANIKETYAHNEAQEARR
jgi:hypothetical protein